jgi:hypothetical protein
MDAELKKAIGDVFDEFRRDCMLAKDVGLDKSISLIALSSVNNKQKIMALIASYSREIQISDREVLIGMFEANKDNISVGEIIATLKGQVEAIKAAEPEGKPNE